MTCLGNRCRQSRPKPPHNSPTLFSFVSIIGCSARCKNCQRHSHPYFKNAKLYCDAVVEVKITDGSPHGRERERPRRSHPKLEREIELPSST